MQRIVVVVPFGTYSNTHTPVSYTHLDVYKRQALDNVKQLFNNNLHLYHPEKEGKYVLYTEASGVAVGGVLYQQNKEGDFQVIAYANRS